MDSSLEAKRESYFAFLRGKIPQAEQSGFDPPSECHHSLFPHQRDLCTWALKGGRRAIFAAFGLGKSRVQLQLAKWITERTNGKYLIVSPLGVRQEFTQSDGPAMGLVVEYCRTDAEVAASSASIIITNYERVRDGDINVSQFAGAGLDEASVLRSYGSKTYQEFLNLFKAVPYRFVFTATPSPNRHKELIHYAGFLGIMDTGDALTRFFKRDSEQANNLTLMPSMEGQFWKWLNSWAVFLQRPSDLGYDDTGYDLPPMNVHWHRVLVDNRKAWQHTDSWGQAQLFQDQAAGLAKGAEIKRESIELRVAKAVEIMGEHEPDRHWIVWHDLEDERRAIEKALPDSRSVFGAQDLEEREERVMGFTRGEFRILAAKPVLCGSGCNFQRHCADAIFLGVGYKFNDFIQACHRIRRYLQTKEVNIHLIYLESEDSICEALKEKWSQHERLMAQMQQTLRENKLTTLNPDMELKRTLGVQRAEVKGDRFTVIHNDSILETMEMPDNSVHFVCTSIPFGNQYEYSPSFNDLGHNKDNGEFFRQMSYLVPEILRCLQPGRIAAIHVKDRIRFGNVTGYGCPTVEPFSDMTVKAFTDAGFLFMARITIDTDVVRENAQTYRLGWSENAKDSSKMGAGMPEYVLIFRKLPSDLSKAYADVRVTKDKEEYTRADWQLDAAGLWRSNGNRLPDPDILLHMPMEDVKRLWIEYAQAGGYDHTEHAALAKALEERGKLPSSFMLFPAVSRNADIWTDIARMRTLNSEQSRRNEENHVCIARGSLILTQDGYIPIEDVRVGTLVLTHMGRWRPVLAKRNMGVKRVVQLEAQGVAQLKCTPDHKVWTRSRVGRGGKGWIAGSIHPAYDRRRAKKATPQWIEAQHTLGSYVNLPLAPIEDSPLSTDDWWIIGRYLGDGHLDSRNRPHISCHHNEAEELLKRLGKRAGSIAKRQTVTQIAVKDRAGRHSTEFTAVLRRCGRGAAGKRLPVEALSLPVDKAEALLSGYLSADGHYVAKYKRYTASTVSRALALGMAMIAQRACGVVATVYAGRPPGKTTIEGRSVTTRQDWILSIPPRNVSALMLADGAWKKVRSLEDAGECEVWDIQVSEDESFVAEGCVVHNCPLQLDIIKRLITRYTNPDEIVLDPFGGIGSTGFQALKMGRRAVLIELNAEYWRCAVGYCEQAEAEQNVPTLFDLAALTPTAAAA